MALTVAAIVKRVVDARKMHSLGQQPSFGTPISGSPHLDQKSYNTEKTQSPHLKQQQPPEAVAKKKSFWSGLTCC